MDAVALYDRIENAVDPADRDDDRALDKLRAFTRETFPPGHGKKLEAAGTFPVDEIRTLAKTGILHEWGESGTFREWPQLTRAAARLASHDLDFSLILGGAILGAIPIVLAGTDTQRRDYLQSMADGEVGGLGLSEWRHGADLLANEATATMRDGRFLLRGTKGPVNNGSRGEWVTFLFRTAPEKEIGSFSLFMVHRDDPGVRTSHRYPTVGHRSMQLVDVTFDDVRLEPARMVGGLGDGFEVARRTLEISRCGVAAFASGATVRALALGLSHANGRELYGAPIAQLDGVKRLLASTLAKAIVSVALVRHSSKRVEADDGRAWSGAAKYLSAQNANEALTLTGTVLGARSLMEDGEFARLRRAIPVLAIFDGASELQLDEMWRYARGWNEASGPTEALRRNARTPLESAFVCASESLGTLAGRVRALQQDLRFRFSEAVIRSYAYAALFEARARTGAPILDDAIRIDMLESGLAYAQNLSLVARALGDSTAEDTAQRLGSAVLASPAPESGEILARLDESFGGPAVAHFS